MKQLALITLALKRTQNEGTKHIARSVNGSGSVHKVSADTHVRDARDVESPKKSVENTTNSRSFTNGDGHSDNGTAPRADNVPKSTFSSEGSLSKVDFWKESVTPSAVVDKMVVNASSAAASDGGDGPDTSKIGSYFNGRKRTVSTPNAPLDNVPNMRNSESEVLPEPEDASSYVEQPDYDSDSWLR